MHFVARMFYRIESILIYAWSNLPVIFWLVVMSTLVSILVMIHSGLYCRAMASLYHLVTDLQSYCQPGQAQTKRQEHTDMEEKREVRIKGRDVLKLGLFIGGG